MDRSLRDGFNKRELVWYGVTGVLFAGLLYFADVDQFLAALGQVDIPLFSIAVGVGFSSLLVWAWVWHRFFGQLEIRSTVSKTVKMFLTGHFLNSITPLGQFGGEPIMAYIISDTTGSDYENSLACVISSDIVNAAPFFTFPIGGILYLSLVGTVQGFLVEVGLIAVSIFTLGGVIAYFLWSDTGRLGAFLIRLLDFLEDRFGRGRKLFRSLRGSVDKVVASFEKAGSDPRFLLETVTVSHLAILAQIVSLYFVFMAMGIDPRVVPLYFIVTLSTIATLSPTPGGSGTYEAAFSVLMTLFYSVELATALSAAVLFRLTTYWPGILVGFISFVTLDSHDAEDEGSQELD